MLGTVDRARLSDVVASRLKEFIHENALKPGDRLPTEATLAANFGVSRLSLREATKSLGFLGIVEAKPGRGLTVGRMNMGRVTEYLGFHPGLQDVDSLVLIDTRVVIETGVLPYVAVRMSGDAAIYDRLSGINRKLRDAKTLQRWVELDIEFHRCLIESSGLTPLLAFAEVVGVFFHRFRESVKKAEWSDGIAGHQAILDALRSNQVAKAQNFLREHIESHKDRLGKQSY